MFLPEYGLCKSKDQTSPYVLLEELTVTGLQFSVLHRLSSQVK